MQTTASTYLDVLLHELCAEGPTTVSGQGHVEMVAAHNVHLDNQQIVWCGVLAACGTDGGMDAAIEPTRMYCGVSRKRRGHRALD
ncbi:hypothetical protein [Xanthomonas phaseoli]|uniref:Uncharacterized protein n=6 Tax=Xanthomonas TaxID=338 RepID=A0A8I2BVP9_XANMN|nr:hypothetical protein [Xanthomonas phaseoli]KUF21397.1 hypothetical protein AO826_02915 [Xanthomonas phaseoli pv. manihotis]MBO9720751.1 hypothetical protein [Xanthomonas phaseoli pv. manihotis]MBO9755284.1 hypothetical protein [Xanthomonas phaseoli pv. manihotis]MBO9761639.1 hypothetical protein [Xanthomonas phaseoli pv. manihotis]MBO9765744.1 hypothetical protein [Xanthomonas phaseoli pv. manihotis]